MGKIILKTAAITMVVIIVLLAIASGLLIWLAPDFVATSAEKLGFEGVSLSMYERSYKQDKTINSLYTLVNKSIQFKDDDMLIKYYEKLEEHKDYTKFIKALDEANFDAKQSVLTNIKLSNEDNRLKTRYVKALAKKDFTKALNFAAQDMLNFDANADKLNFCVIGLVDKINKDNISKFTENNEILTESVCQKIESMYNALKDRYENVAESTYNKALCSAKLVDMLQFMILLKDQDESVDYDKTALTNDLAIIFAQYQNYIK